MADEQGKEGTTVCFLMPSSALQLFVLFIKMSNDLHLSPFLSYSLFSLSAGPCFPSLINPKPKGQFLVYQQKYRHYFCTSAYFFFHIWWNTKGHLVNSQLSHKSSHCKTCSSSLIISAQGNIIQGVASALMHRSVRTSCSEKSFEDMLGSVFFFPVTGNIHSDPQPPPPPKKEKVSKP